MNKSLLGVNIDHVATLRNARNTKYPNILYAAFLAEQGGADSITVHLREDRRHITDNDIFLLKDSLSLRMNLEMAVTNEMLDIACNIKPSSCCLVPEKREEKTTEHGLDVIKNIKIIKNAINMLNKFNILVSLFVDPEFDQIDAAVDSGAQIIEIHTGFYSNAENEFDKLNEFNKLNKVMKYASSKNIVINAGHGLNYENIRLISDLNIINEFNIGHSIVGKALFVGMIEAVKSMKKIICGV